MDIQLYEDITDRFINGLLEYPEFRSKPTVDQLHHLLYLISLNKNITILSADIEDALFCVKWNHAELTIRIYISQIELSLEKFAENIETPMMVNESGQLTQRD